MHKKLFSNTSSNVLKLTIAEKTFQNVHEKKEINMVKPMVACVNLWSPDLKKCRRYQKVKIES